MHTPNLVQLIPALLLDVMALALLYLSWEGFIVQKRVAIWSGWAMLVGSTIFWSKALGAEFGVTLAFLAPPLAAWAFVVAGADFRAREANHRGGRRRRQDETDDSIAPENKPMPTRWTRHGLLFLLTVPVAGVCCSLISLAFVDLLPGSEVNRLVFAVFLMPTLWGIAAYWLTAAEHHARPLAWLGGSALLSSLWLFAF